MKRIKDFKVFESEVSLTSEQVEILDKCVSGTWQINAQTGLVDVDGWVRLDREVLTKIPVRFGMITRDFNCSRNRLTSLEGAPKSVGGCFYCSWNELTSLEGAPKSVGMNFNCRGNGLTSLVGAPESVGRDFNCLGNELISLEGAPEIVGGDFECFGDPAGSLLRIIYKRMREWKITYQSALFLCYSEIINKENSELLYKSVNVDPLEIVSNLLRKKIPGNYEDLFIGFPEPLDSLAPEELDLSKKLTKRWRLLQRD